MCLDNMKGEKLGITLIQYMMRKKNPRQISYINADAKIKQKKNLNKTPRNQIQQHLNQNNVYHHQVGFILRMQGYFNQCQ